jgi:hypothetical protein
VQHKNPSWRSHIQNTSLELSRQPASRSLAPTAAATMHALRRFGRRFSQHAGPPTASTHSRRTIAAAAGYELDAAERSRAIAARFEGKACLVQGASRGLGLELTRQLLAVPSTR